MIKVAQRMGGRRSVARRWAPSGVSPAAAATSGGRTKKTFAAEGSSAASFCLAARETRFARVQEKWSARVPVAACPGQKPCQPSGVTDSPSIRGRNSNARALKSLSLPPPVFSPSDVNEQRVGRIKQRKPVAQCQPPRLLILRWTAVFRR